MEPLSSHPTSKLQFFCLLSWDANSTYFVGLLDLKISGIQLALNNGCHRPGRKLGALLAWGQDRDETS